MVLDSGFCGEDEFSVVFDFWEFDDFDEFLRGFEDFEVEGGNPMKYQ